jgi:hypothetical protein
MQNARNTGDAGNTGNTGNTQDTTHHKLKWSDKEQRKDKGLNTKHMARNE